MQNNEEEQDLFQKLEESRLALPNTQQKESSLYNEDNVSEAGSLGSTSSAGKDDHPSKSFSSNLYRLLFEDDPDTTKLAPFFFVFFVISVLQFIPLYMGLAETLPYISCTNNFCIGNSFELVESKIPTLCRNAEPDLGETHYFSAFHRFLLAYTAIITNFFGFLGVGLLVFRWNKLFAELHYFKVVAYFAAQLILFFLSTALIKVIDWNNMKPEAEYSLVPADVSGCINMSVIYSYYRPDDIHNQFWIVAAIYFPLFIISMFRFLWDSIKLQDCREWTFSFSLTVIGSSTLAGWIFALIINYAAGIQFSILSDASEQFRNQQIVNLSVTGIVFLTSLGFFSYKRFNVAKEIN